jgi:hypothetical protein
MGQMCSALNKFSVFQFIISASHQASLAWLNKNVQIVRMFNSHGWDEKIIQHFGL